MNIIDRRLNSGSKSLANRQRFLRRAKSLVQQAVRNNSKNRSIKDFDQGGEVTIQTDSLREPRLHRAPTGGRRDGLLPGNKKFVQGDTIPKDKTGGGGSGSDGIADGSGEDDFRFMLSQDEYLDLFFDDLELPDLAKKRLASTESFSLHRAGYSVSGSPANLSLTRTMRNSLSRRVALQRPKSEDILRLEAEIVALEGRKKDAKQLAELRATLDKLVARSKRVPFIDPIDIRFRRFQPVPKPIAKAVMFCLMDTSASMTEHMKDLAKRFFALLYIFLKRRYRHVEVVFIRHTHEASEVDEDTFFNSPETGGTVVSSALEEMISVAAARFPREDWNIYGAQASDGDNTVSDSGKTAALLQHRILPLCQYFAYLEVGQENQAASMGFVSRQTELWRTYETLKQAGAPFAMCKVHHRNEIYPVFRELFERKPQAARQGRRMIVADTKPLLYEGTDWNFETIQRIHNAIAEIAGSEFKLDTYPNQIEIITTEQMLDAYSSVGMPLFYKHWSFGKHFAQHETGYRKGLRGLAYEIVINSDPCISYIMEENTATMQTLVIAHAAFGHNHFFKNNYLFRQWTDAEGILHYLDFAKSYVAECEERYGHLAVERLLDAAHALMSHGVHRFPRKRKPDLLSENRRERERRIHGEQVYNDLWRTVPGKGRPKPGANDDERRRALLEIPQENILYFLEKTAPRLQPWQREIIRIVRLIAQYFYPQGQTKVMNEGCATYCHYRIMNRLYETGQINEGSYLEFLQSHTNVVMQPEYDDPRYNGINPYALGFAMMQDIERICREPTDEDREWFPDIAGAGEPFAVLTQIWANYRDESFISQYLSPHLMRRWKMFHVLDEGDKAKDVRVESIHDERGYRKLRRALAKQYDVAWTDPDIQIVDVDLGGDRRLMLQHAMLNGIPLEERETKEVLQHLADLWGYDVELKEVDAAGAVAKEHSARSRPSYISGADRTG